jgi:Transglutaminase-like superfamily
MTTEISKPARYGTRLLKSCDPMKSTAVSPETPGHSGSPYYLANHIFACATLHGAVFLDLRRNRYFGLNLSDVVSLADSVSDWPAKRFPGQTVPAVPLDGPRKNALAQSLLEAKVLHLSQPSECGIGRSTFPLDGDLASVGDEIITEARVRTAHVISFLLSLLSAYVSLRFLSLSTTVRIVHGRKARAISRGYRFDSHRAAELTFIFRRLRVYLFSANGNCMLHALALVNFMAKYHEFPSWVLGVRTEPWGAHSWVQHEMLLLDTNPSKVCPYIPLLSV